MPEMCEKGPLTAEAVRVVENILKLHVCLQFARMTGRLHKLLLTDDEVV